MLLKLCYSCLIIYLLSKNAIAKEAYEENVDELFETMLGELYKVSHNFTIPTKFAINMKKNDSKREHYDFNIFNTKIPQFPSKNITLNTVMEYLKSRKIEMYIDELLNSGNNQIPDFHKDIDEIGLITRRFDKIRELSKKTRRDDQNKQTDHNPRHEVESYGKRIINIMLQFIYETRYRLPYAQLLRNKYKNNLRYKIGYCFALLRHLKQQQLILYGGLKTWAFNPYHERTLNYDIQIYEKLIRLDVDIKDVIKLVKKMEYNRKIMENPTYYDDDFTVKKPISGPMRVGADRMSGPKKVEELYNRFRGEKKNKLWNPSFSGLGPERIKSRRLYSGDPGSLKKENPASTDLSFGNSQRSPEKSRLEDQGVLARRSPGIVDSESIMGFAGPTSGRVKVDSKTSTVLDSTTSPKRSRYSRLWSVGFGL